MSKRIASVFLCICLLFSTILPARAAQEETPQYLKYTVSNLDSFLNLAEKCRLDSFSQNLQVILNTDIDLSGTNFKGFPTFSGIFEGNGHTIKGLSLFGDGSVQGLFRYLTVTASVQNLKVIGTVQPGGSGSKSGGIAGSNEGKILNCTFTGYVSGNEYIGGIAGVNAVNGIIENCSISGKVYGNHFVGGIVGENRGVIRSCTNEAKVNDTALENEVELSEITLDSITGSESISTVTDIGGITGSSIGVIRECVNRGDVGYQHMGYNIGGIAGTQSGALLDCVNYAKIQGRKEVGGIVGQLEPTALIDYAEDALQILRRQLSSMGSVVSDTVSNIQSTSDSIVGQVATLQDHVWNAKDAVASLIPDREDPQLPDLDTIQAAQNTISSSISGMTQTLQGMSATTYGAMGAMSTNLYALQNQINAMRTTLGNVSETLGGSLKDVSDDDTETDLTGKVSGCINSGSVLADRNAGGIAGAIAMENDLDYEDDWSIHGDNSLNFESELRAVILGCVNTAQVTCKKQNAGGIVGLQSMGLVKDCSSSGLIMAEGADHVGGISGQSLGYIRSSSAKCEITAASYAGGIAGSATIVTDCRSLVQLDGGTEKLGSILGYAEQPHQEEEEPILGNLYLRISEDIGGIDGISYTGKAEPASREAFLALEGLPDMFRNVSIRFLYKNGQERTFTVPLGDSFNTSWIPQIPPKSGYAASWTGLDEEDFKEVLFDMTYELEYVGKSTTLQSGLEENDRPVLLVQGIFAENSVLTVEKMEAAVPLEKGEVLLQAWDFAVTEAESITAARILLPEGHDGTHVKLMVCAQDGIWRQPEQAIEGSYAVVPLENGDCSVLLIQTESDMGLTVAAAASVAAVILLTVILYRRRKRQTKGNH